MIEENKMPEFLISMLEKQYGEDIAKRILQGYRKRRLTTLRANTLKANNTEIEEALEKAQIAFEKVSWYQEAFVIKNASEKEIQTLPIYEQGKIYLQSLSSMLPPIVLEPKKGEDILDMTAAPRRKDNTTCSYFSKSSPYYSLRNE